MTVLGNLIETADAKRTRLRHNAKSGTDPLADDSKQAGAAHYELPTPSGTLFLDMADANLMMHLSATRSSSAVSARMSSLRYASTKRCSSRYRLCIVPGGSGSTTVFFFADLACFAGFGAWVV